MILWRQGCEACRADSEPCPEQYHELIHELLDKTAPPDISDAADELDEVEDELGRAFSAIEDAQSALDRLRRHAKGRRAA